MSLSEIMAGHHWAPRLNEDVSLLVLEALLGDAFRAAKNSEGARAFCGLIFKLSVLNKTMFDRMKGLCKGYIYESNDRRYSAAARRDKFSFSSKPYLSADERYKNLDAIDDVLQKALDDFERVSHWMMVRSYNLWPDLDKVWGITEWMAARNAKLEAEEAAQKLRKRVYLPGAESEDDQGDGVDDEGPSRKRQRAV